MGLASGLLKRLKGILTNIHISSYHGRTVGVDLTEM